MGVYIQALVFVIILLLYHNCILVLVCFMMLYALCIYSQCHSIARILYCICYFHFNFNATVIVTPIEPNRNVSMVCLELGSDFG